MAEVLDINVYICVNKRTVQKVGPAYLNSKHYNSNYIQSPSSEKTQIVDDLLVDIQFLKSLDPKEWKSQDHYAVLGLGKLRYNATDDDIRRAYRKIVLQHHPDKRKVIEENFNAESDYFTCITKAYEILGTPKSRRSYDSVDPEFDDSLPSQQDIEYDFYGTLGNFFLINGRWSERRDVPSLGSANSSRKDVEKFYSFWYDFKSWREFSYLDEEDKEKGQDRDERRWIEKENKAARIKRKKEEMLRIRTLVDLAYNNDKRIQKFKLEEKEKKLAAKKAKINVVQAQKAEQERALKEAQLAKENAEKVEKKRIEQLRFEKELTKKALKKERKFLRDKAKDNNYFSNNERSLLAHIEGIEKICEIFTLVELQALNKQLAENPAKDTFLNALTAAELKIKTDLDEATQKQNKRNAKNNVTKLVVGSNMWTNDNIQLLIKAVNLFPAGTPQRWDVIATFINQHSTDDVNISAQDVLKKAKALQNSDFSQNSLKNHVNASAFESFENTKRDLVTTTDITINRDGCSIVNNNSKLGIKLMSKDTPSPTKVINKAWTKEEQAFLEQAIKTYPISTPDRWDHIAECVPNRTKKDCLRRVKELVEIVNSKKGGQNKTNY